MGSFSILKIVLLFCVAGQISAQWWKKEDCCYDLRCWEKCFEDVKDPLWRNAFNQIYKVYCLFDWLLFKSWNISQRNSKSTHLSSINAKKIILQIVNGIRGLYSPCSRPAGTCFSLDSTVHSAGAVSGSDMMEFERNLAAIIALTQPVSNENNPFFLNKFYETFTWAADSELSDLPHLGSAQLGADSEE